MSESKYGTEVKVFDHFETGNPSERVYCKVIDKGGKMKMDMRVSYTSDDTDGMWIPTRKGFRVDYNDAEKLIEYLQEFMELCEGAGKKKKLEAPIKREKKSKGNIVGKLPNHMKKELKRKLLFKGGK